MHFGLSDEQLAMRDMARRFAEERLAPRYREREAEARIEPELIEEMGSLGLIGVDLPEPLGGLDLGGVASGLIIEDIAGGDMNVSYVQLLASLNGSIIAAHALPEIAQDIVPGSARARPSSPLGSPSRAGAPMPRTSSSAPRARTRGTSSTARRRRYRWRPRRTRRSSSPAPGTRKHGRAVSPPSWCASIHPGWR